MTSHVYNTRNNPVLTIEENVSSEANFETSESLVIFLSLQKKLILRFDGFDKEILNLRDVIIKNLQVDTHHLSKKVSYLESKAISLESDHNSLEQYGQRNINGLPDRLTSICKTFADDTSLFSKAFNINESANYLKKCNSILIPTYKQMKLFFQGNQILVF